MIQDHPDVILINVPGNLLSFDNNVPNTSNIASFLVKILRPDYLIFSMMSLDYNEISRQINYVSHLMMKEIDAVILTDHSVNVYK